MFCGCYSLTALDLSNFDTSKETYMSEMFKGCESLTTIYCNSSWSCKESDDMFSNCDSLKGAVTYNASKTDVNMANPETGYFKKNVLAQAAYVHLNADETILTFYYDTLRDERDGTTWGIGETRMYNDNLIPAWADTKEFPYTNIHTAVFDASFRDFCPTTTREWFYRLKSLKSVENLQHLNTSKVKNMRGMFSGCKSLTTLDLSSFDTSKVTDMNGMFCVCSSMTSLNLSSFDTSKVKDMSWMFSGCESLAALDLSNFDTAKVTDMGELFTSCRQLKCIAWGKFQLQEEVNLTEVFSNCPSLTQITCHPNSEFNDLKRLFEHCALLKNAVDYHQLSSLLQQNKASNIKIPLQTPISPILEAYVVQSANQTTLTFYYDKKRFSHTTHSWSVYECNSNNPTWQHTSKTTLKVIFTASFKKFRPTSTAHWFQKFKSLKSIKGLEHLNTSKVTDMREMFYACESLTSLGLSNFDTSKVEYMNGMFCECSSLPALNLSNFDTSKVENMSSMF